MHLELEKKKKGNYFLPSPIGFGENCLERKESRGSRFEQDSTGRFVRSRVVNQACGEDSLAFTSIERHLLNSSAKF